MRSTRTSQPTRAPRLGVTSADADILTASARCDQSFMRSLRLLLATAVILFGISGVRPLQAQAIPGQDSTLVGLKRVFVKFDVSDGTLTTAQLQALQDLVTLEMRKSGIRVLKTLDEVDPAQDGVLLVSLTKIPRSLSTDAVFRMDLRQATRLARTGRSAFSVTWFYEDNGRNVVMEQFAAAAPKRGVNEFLTQWLDVNGR